jgi:hypothetical protein
LRVILFSSYISYEQVECADNLSGLRKCRCLDKYAGSRRRCLVLFLF